MLREHNELMQSAWLTARLTAYAPAKGREFPKVEVFLTREIVAPLRRQTWQEMLAIARAWNAAVK